MSEIDRSEAMIRLGRLLAESKAGRRGAGIPEIVEAVEGKVEVLLDGGIRRGTDIMKAIALGARAVLIGRPIFWGLAVNGEEGLKHLLGILRDEFDSTMGLCGKRNVASIDRSLVGTVSPLMSLPQFPNG